VDEDNNTFTLNLRFPGQYFDKETKTHYNINRDYNPVTGRRYIQSDPIGFDGGINTYLYANANPLVNVDESGLMTKKIDPIETLAKNAYCTAWLAQGIKGCDRVAFQSHTICLSAGSGAYNCQSIYRDLYKECMLENLDCQKTFKDNNESNPICNIFN